jgi:predicted DNA-binding transcriptional regulator AlpA
VGGGVKGALVELEILNLKCAAKYLGISARTLEGWRLRHKGPAYIRIGGRSVKYLKSDLLEYIKSVRVVPSIKKRKQLLEKRMDQKYRRTYGENAGAAKITHRILKETRKQQKKEKIKW